MKAVDRLREEHVLIGEALDRVERALDPLDLETIAQCLEFFRRFADEIHHAKEEEVLFPAVVTQLHDMARGPIDAMTKEHFMGRAYLRAAARSYSDAAHDDEVARALLERSLSSYVVLMRAHIEKENEVLFPFVERALSASADGEMVAEMDRLDAQLAQNDELERLRGLATPPKTPAAPAKSASFIDARTLSDEPEVASSMEETALDARAGAMLFDEGGHQDIWLHDFGRGLAVQANQFMIVDDGEGLILDPGGPKVYPDVYAETMLRLRGGNLRYVFLSHQDPDIGTSLNAWLMDTEAVAYISRLWVRFIPHFGIDRLLEHRLEAIPDEGMTLRLGKTELVLVPAHFLHSAGNFQLYDPRSKILFSGDLGASLATDYSVVRDFDEHAKSMLGFHRRYMPTNAALRAWVKTVEKLDIETIAPQHGAIFKGKAMVERFVDWCGSIECGVDLAPDGWQR